MEYRFRPLPANEDTFMRERGWLYEHGITWVQRVHGMFCYAFDTDDHQAVCNLLHWLYKEKGYDTLKRLWSQENILKQLMENLQRYESKLSDSEHAAFSAPMAAIRSWFDERATKR